MVNKLPNNPFQPFQEDPFRVGSAFGTLPPSAITGSTFTPSPDIMPGVQPLAPLISPVVAPTAAPAGRGGGFNPNRGGRALGGLVIGAGRARGAAGRANIRSSKTIDDIITPVGRARRMGG